LDRAWLWPSADCVGMGDVGCGSDDHSTLHRPQSTLPVHQEAICGRHHGHVPDGGRSRVYVTHPRTDDHAPAGAEPASARRRLASM
jgi:hypothetical protein